MAFYSTPILTHAPQMVFDIGTLYVWHGIAAWESKTFFSFLSQMLLFMIYFW